MIGIFGTIKPPINNPYFTTAGGGGIFLLISNLFKLAGTIAGIYVIFQLITAGYAYISANGDPKKFEAAWNKIWQSLLGLIVVASAFTLAAVIGRVTGIDPLNPVIYAP